MHIRIDNPKDAVPLVGELPGYPVSLLEGPNGIGKSLAIQLVRLISGVQPWADGVLWRSLRTALSDGDVRVSIGNLQSGRTVTALLTPASWPDDPPVVPDDSVAQVEIDGQSATISEVSQLLKVDVFSGTEDLPKVAAQEVEREALHFQPAVDLAHGRIDALRLRIEVVADLLNEANPERRLELEKLIGQKSEEVASCEAGLSEQIEQKELLGRAIELGRLIHGEQDADDDAHAELRQLSDRAAELKVRREEIQGDLSTLLGELAKAGDPEEALEASEKLLESRERTLAKRSAKALELAERFLDGSDATIEAEAVEHLAHEEKRRIENMQEALRGLGAEGRLLSAIDEISLPLASVLDEGFGDQILARVESVDVTARKILPALSAREKEIAEEQPVGRIAELERELDDARERRGDLAKVLKAIKARERAKENRDESIAEVGASREALGKSAGLLKRYDELVSERDKVVEALRTTAEREVELRRSLGLPRLASDADLSAELARNLEELSASEEDLPARFVAAEHEEQEARGSLDAARGQLEALRREREQAAAQLRFAAKRIQQDPTLAWAKTVVENRGGDPSDTESLERLAEATKCVSDLLSNSLDAIQGVAYKLKQAPADGFVDDDSDDLGRVILLTLNERLRRRLDTPEIRAALFEGHELTSVDLKTRSVGWGTDRSAVSRPIESFSTGEQAFAFTQARVLALEPLPEAVDRLLVLDEFGAFVAADRRGKLARFLAGADVTTRATQVIVVLPLRSDYQAEIDETRGDLRKRYQRRMDQLAEQGYISEPFEEEN